MNPPIPKSVCEEEMQNGNSDTNDVIIEYMTDAHGNKIKTLKPLLIKSEPDREYIQHIPVMIISLLYLKKILHKEGSNSRLI